jgi:hypothetical protein
MLTDVDSKLVKFDFPSIDYLKKFILRLGISEQEIITLNDRAFDELALDFRATFQELIPMTFIFEGVWIKMAPYSAVAFNQAAITSDDPRPKPDADHSESIEFKKIYRCGYCGVLLDEFGNGLTGNLYEMAMKRIKRHGETVFVPSVGKCCERRAKSI